MKKGNVNSDRFHISKFVIIGSLFLFLALIVRICYLCLVDYKVGDISISAFIKNRNAIEEVIMPKRGTIYDVNGNILAQDVASYTIIAYLSDTRVDAKGNKDYVEDFDTFSSNLSELIDLSSDEIKEILNNGKENNKYQVEFGPSGKGLSELVKEDIDSLNLQGIGFTKDVKRYYPNGDFASYLLGYTVNKEDEDGNVWMVGELGIEEYYDDILRGKAGYITYEKDKYGYKIANGREYVKPAVDGQDIYLTIDNNIELFLENAVKSSQEASGAEWTIMVAENAKTGEILGYYSTPSYDPNIRNMTSYIDPLIGNAYEPGSTMKIFSYMCAIDSGKYNGNDTYLSGTKTYTSEVDDSTVTISDWNKKGWGTISYDQGFALSSNIAVATIVENVITKDELRACYEKYGFGSKTGIELEREEEGNISYTYQIEAATAGYGQGITTTPIQHVKALTAIANDGTMIKPYLVSKIEDTTNKKTTYVGKTEELDKIAETSTINKLKELMNSVITGDNTNSTGYAYYMDNYSLIGKTGTAQIFDYTKGSYMTGDSDYIYSFSGLFPQNDPEIILYAAVKRPKDTTNYIAPMIKEVEVNISKYLNIEEKHEEKKEYTLDSYLNKNINSVKESLESNSIRVLVLGDGHKVVGMYPSKNSKITEGDLVILKSNHLDNTMIDLTGYSKKEVLNILKFMNMDYELEGTGYVYEQSIAPGSTTQDKITIKLKKRY